MGVPHSPAPRSCPHPGDRGNASGHIATCWHQPKGPMAPAKTEKGPQLCRCCTGHWEGDWGYWYGFVGSSYGLLSSGSSATASQPPHTPVKPSHEAWGVQIPPAHSDVHRQLITNAPQSLPDATVCGQQDQSQSAPADVSGGQQVWGCVLRQRRQAQGPGRRGKGPHPPPHPGM